MDAFLTLLVKTFTQVEHTFIANWPFLVVSIFIAVLLKLFVDISKVSDFLMRYRKAGVIAATAAAVTTPLCSCGTTAIILGMMASTMPWAPIVAFMVASPLTSPEELVYSAGLFGWPFALAFFIASILLGLLGGLTAGIFESRGWLAGQARFSREISRTASVSPACGCGSAIPSAQTSTTRYCCEVETIDALKKPEAPSCSCGTQASPVSPSDSKKFEPKNGRVSIREFGNELLSSGGRLILMFFGFAFIGYFLNNLIPSAWITAVFGQGNIYSVPLAATLGLPLYINTEGSLPLVRALIDGGMSQGAALAFLITGSGTSIGAIAGALTIARWRIIALVIGVLWVGAIAVGYGYNLLLATGIL